MYVALEVCEKQLDATMCKYCGNICTEALCKQHDRHLTYITFELRITKTV